MRDELLGERLSHDIWATSKRLYKWIYNNRLVDDSGINFGDIAIDLADASEEITCCLVIIKNIVEKVEKNANP